MSQNTQNEILSQFLSFLKVTSIHQWNSYIEINFWEKEFLCQHKLNFAKKSFI